MSSLTDLRTLRSLLSDAANTLKSSMYKRSVIFRLIGFDNLYPSVVLKFQATGFRHKVKSLRQNELSCYNTLWKIIISDVSVAYLVLSTILVLFLLLNCRIATPNHQGNRWSSYISPKSKAFLTSTQGILRFNTCLPEWKLSSLYMFHRILFLLLIISSLSCNFNRCADCFQSFSEQRFPEYSKCRALNHFKIKNKHYEFFIILELNCVNFHSKHSPQLALQKSEPAGRIGDFGKFFNGLAKAPACFDRSEYWMIAICIAKLSNTAFCCPRSLW